MKSYLNITFYFLSIYLINCYKISLDNGKNMLRVESNRLRNGKPIDEPKPSDAINAMSSLGFKVVNMEAEENEPVSETNQQSNDANSANLKRPTSSTLPFELKPSEPIEEIFKKIVNTHLASGSKEKVKSLSGKKKPYQPSSYDPNTVSQHKIELDSVKYGSFDIYITNVNENSNNNNGTVGNGYE